MNKYTMHGGSGYDEGIAYARTDDNEQVADGYWYRAADADIHIAELKLERDGMLEKIVELRAALLKYGWHECACHFLTDTVPCTCGFEDLRKSL